MLCCGQLISATQTPFIPFIRSFIHSCTHSLTHNIDVTSYVTCSNYARCGDCRPAAPGSGRYMHVVSVSREYGHVTSVCNCACPINGQATSPVGPTAASSHSSRLALRYGDLQHVRDDVNGYAGPHTTYGHAGAFPINNLARCKCGLDIIKMWATTERLSPGDEVCPSKMIPLKKVLNLF